MSHNSITRCDCRDPHQSAQRGFTLVELMIAILIGLFLVGGLLTLTSAMKRTGSIQSGLSQMHDNERIALSLMTDVIQSSGYFPSPIGSATASSAFVATGSWAAAQTILGTDVGSGSTQTDTISVRYASAGSDGVLNCLGATSAVAATWIANFTLDGAGNLQCQLTTNGTVGTPTPIATGVQYMQILYGVQTNTSSGTFSVDTYLTATQVNSGSYWPNVISVQVTLSMVNPLYCTTNCTAGQQTSQPQYIQVSRTIALMGRAGINTT
jgi:type IV pilus assembly protein PilW